NYVVPGSRPLAFDVFMVTIVSLGCLVGTLYAAVVVTSNRRLALELVASTAGALASQQHEEQLRARLARRMQLAREQAYERAVSYAGHELRNPLHAVSGLLEMARALLQRVLDSSRDRSRGGGGAAGASDEADARLLRSAAEDI